MKLSERIVARIFNDLEGRSGFDHWWDLIDADIQEEIVVELAEIVDAELASG